MTREQFKEQMFELIKQAEQELSNPANVLDLRAYRFNDVDNYQYEYDIFSVSEIDEAYTFVNGTEEWYVDIFENFVGENYAEFVDKSIYYLAE